LTAVFIRKPKSLTESQVLRLAIGKEVRKLARGSIMTDVSTFTLHGLIEHAEHILKFV